jgi:hypothetical protein
LRNKRSWITWGIIFAILVGSGLLTILLPAMFGGNSATALPRDPTTVTIPLPLPISGRSEVTLPSWQLMIGLAILVPGLVIGAGLTLGIIIILIQRLIARTTTSSDYQQSAAALQRRQTEKVAKLRETRPTSAAPESTWRRWAVFTTALTVLLFTAFLAFLVGSMLFPQWQIVRQDAIVNIVSLIVLAALLLAVIFMVMWLRADRIAAFNRGDTLAIPWDFLAVVVTGLLVVGLGIGLIAVLNAP